LNPIDHQNNMAQIAARNLFFVDDSYQGDINPGTTDGAKSFILKPSQLFQKKTNLI